MIINVGSGKKITLDDSLSSTSENPVKNKVIYTALGGKAPTSHAVSAATYGAGTASNYGHVKLSDSTSSVSTAASGVAASPAAVKAAYDLANGKEGKHTTTTVSLTVASWSSLAQTVSVSGVTTSNSVICTPAPASHDAYCKAGVYCSAQASGKLTFKCTTKPTAALTVNVMILGG